MKQLTEEWISKAEGDYHTMLRESRAEHFPNFDAVCFHAQQCVEKYLKARMCEAEVRIGRSHDLVAILEMAMDIEPSWRQFKEDMAYLSQFSVVFRYPGESADASLASDSIDRCERFRQAARTSFGLE